MACFVGLVWFFGLALELVWFFGLALTVSGLAFDVVALALPVLGLAFGVSTGFASAFATDFVVLRSGSATMPTHRYVEPVLRG